MNVTEKLLQSRPHGDVREASRGDAYPLGVIIHTDPETGELSYQGFNAATGTKTSYWYRDREDAISVLKVLEKLRSALPLPSGARRELITEERNK